MLLSEKERQRLVKIHKIFLDILLNTYELSKKYENRIDN